MARENFNQLWASNPDPDQFEAVPAEIFDKGWEGGADKPLPQAKWENWWHRRVDVTLQQIEREGVLEYLSDVPYAVGAPVKASNGARFLSLVDDNEGNDPALDIAQQFWLPYAVNGRATTELLGLMRFATIDEHTAGNAQNRAATPRGVREMIARYTAPLIALNGPTAVPQISTTEYAISAFDSFSTYSASVDVGSVSLVDDALTLTLVSGDNASGEVTITIERDGTAKSFSVGVINVNIDRPVNVFPAEGAIDIQPTVTLEATEFSVTGGSDTPTGSRWRIYDELSGTLVYDSGEIAYSNTHAVPAGELSPTAARYEWDVAYRGATYGLSEYSARTLFTTVDEFISTPSITAPADGASDQPEQPILESSAFAVTPSGADTHQTSSWRVKNSAGTVVWQSLNNPSALLAITIPAGVLNVSEAYTAEVRHEGVSLVSAWSAESSFTTEAQFVPSQPGTPFGGGYFVRVMFTEPGGAGQEYALVVSSASATGQLQSTYAEAETTAQSLTEGGFSDWELPTIDELRVMYRAFKPEFPGFSSNNTTFGATDKTVPSLPNYATSDPDRTDAVAFQEGGSEAFLVNVGNPEYWSRTANGSLYLANQFENGTEVSLNAGQSGGRQRPVRRVYL